MGCNLALKSQAGLSESGTMAVQTMGRGVRAAKTAFKRQPWLWLFGLSWACGHVCLRFL